MNKPDYAQDGRVLAARSFFFAPGDREDRIGSALASDADVVIVDLEDSVQPDRRLEAGLILAPVLDCLSRR